MNERGYMKMNRRQENVHRGGDRRLAAQHQDTSVRKLWRALLGRRGTGILVMRPDGRVQKVYASIEQTNLLAGDC